MRVLIANAGDWTFVNTVQFLVAVGALATAIVAVVALFLTRRSVKLAQDELETTTAALESSVRPLLTFDKRAFMRTVPARDSEPAIVSVPVRNVGPRGGRGPGCLPGDGRRDAWLADGRPDHPGPGRDPL